MSFFSPWNLLALVVGLLLGYGLLWTGSLWLILISGVVLLLGSVYQGQRVELVLRGSDIQIREPKAELELPESFDDDFEDDEQTKDAAWFEPYRVEDEYLAMIELPDGEFMMGAEDNDPLAYDDERPQHVVQVSAFAIAETPITQGLYRKIMVEHSLHIPRDWKNNKKSSDYPANNINWFDALRFCNQLSIKSGLIPCYDENNGWQLNQKATGYRLPTEAEWEYACRAGTKTPWYWGDDENTTENYAWFSVNSNRHLQIVKQKKPNAWGLYDMSGLVWEWNQDTYEPYDKNTKVQVNPLRSDNSNVRIFRGGSFLNDSPIFLCSTFRAKDGVERSYGGIGFRCVRIHQPR